jgi:hypothetical protein
MKVKERNETIYTIKMNSTVEKNTKQYSVALKSTRHMYTMITLYYQTKITLHNSH